MPLFWLSLAFMAGVLFSARFSLTADAWLVTAGMCLVLALALALLKTLRTAPADGARSKVSIPPFSYSLVPLIFTLGAARYQLAQPDFTAPDFIAAYNDSGDEVRVVGTVVRPPKIQEGGVTIRVKVEGMQPSGKAGFLPVAGLLDARLAARETWRYGDRVILRGQLQTPPEFEDFSYRAYLAHQGVYSYMGNTRAYRLSSGGGNPVLRLIYTYKTYALDTIYRLWPDPEAALLAGILLGDESGISDRVDQAFRDTGTSHIIVISGFNITIIAGLLVGVSSRLFGGGQVGVRRGAIFAITGVVIYTILVGAEAAVVRAAIMGTTALFASLVGRRQDGLNTLAVVAALMTAAKPSILWDVGFLLSFAATLGLVLYAEPLMKAFEKLASRILTVERAQKWSQPVGEYLLFTLAAQVLVLPIIVYYFQRISLSALIANPLILPAQPPVMILGGLALLAGTIYYPLGQVLAWIAWPFVLYTIRVVEFLAAFQGGALSLGEVSAVFVVGFYAILFGLTLTGARSKQAAQMITPGVTLAGLSVLAVLVWRMVLSAPDGRLHMTILNVGTGDSVLIQTPSGRKVLIDGGPSTRLLSGALGRRLPFGDRRLDWLVVAGTGEGQTGGLPRNLERFPPQQVLWAGPTAGSYPARDLQARLAEMGVPVVTAIKGQALNLGDGATLHVREVGKRGAVLLLEWGNFRALLPIGLDFETLESMQDAPDLEGLTALLLAESGYAPVNPGEWIGKLNPQGVLLSVAAGDAGGLPSPETLEVLKGYNLLRTDLNGWIKLSTDGEQMWVEVERKKNALLRALTP
jgi:competence protein ComEC